MPVGVKGQYQFTFNLNGKSDFLREADLQGFTMIEDAGGQLPTFSLVFSTKDRTILGKVNEGSTFNVIMDDGKGGQGLTTSLFIATSKVKRTKGTYEIALAGVYNAPNYGLKQRTEITPKQASVKSIMEKVKLYFKAEFDVQTSADVQCWIQHNISDRRFVQNCVAHCNLPNSFPIIGITSDGTFRFRDARKMAGKKHDVEFGYTSGYSIDDHEIETNTAFMNSQGGYGITQVETELESDSSRSPVKVTEPVTNIFTKASTLNRNADAPKRQLPPVSWSRDNVNKDYWEAFRRNLASLAAYSATMLQVTSRTGFIKVRVCDLAMFKDEEVGGNTAEESYSGLYIVTKVARTLQKRSLSTTVQMTREGVNTQEGRLR